MQEHILKNFRQSSVRLLLLDYDGTLVGFAPTPPEAVPGKTLLATLDRLANDPNNTVVIISGRDKGTLEAWLGHLPLVLVAEHGQFAKLAGQPWQTLSPINEDWKEPVRQIMAASMSLVPGSFIEQKSTSFVWHNRVSDAELAYAESPKLLSRLATAAKKYKLTLLQGNRNIEARLGGVTKGTAGRLWLQKNDWDFILAAGDDTTDEDLFRAMPRTAHTIKIGPGETSAREHVSSPGDFVEFLSSLAS